MASAGSRPTLEDVAEAAGVSTATVSRCLNTPQRVVEKTRVRVEAAIVQLGYTPNLGARMMAAKRTMTIGAIIPTMENAIFARGLQAFQEELHQRGYTLLVSSTAYRAEAEAEQIRTLVARGADGLLLIGHERAHEIYEFLDGRGVPALVAWSYAEDGRLRSIGFDNRLAMQALTEKVLALGHTRIAMIAGISEGNDRARERIEGFRAALRTQGQDDAAFTVIESSYGIAEGGGAFDALMRGGTRPTAVICGNDVLAAGALMRAKAWNLRVPEDVSITGFDNIELARIVSPSLTTVQVPHREMGHRAAMALVDMVEGGAEGASLVLPTSIEMRESLGPPPRSWR